MAKTRGISDRELRLRKRNLMKRGISDRELRLRKRNLMKLPDEELAKIQAKTRGISDRELRLRKRNLMKLPDEELAKIQAAPSGIKKRSEKTLEELEVERRIFEKFRADWLQERKEFAKMKSQRLKDEEEKEPWPPQWRKPIKESIQYECGIITSFVDDPWGVLNMNEDDFKRSSLYKACGSDDDPQLLINLKKLIRQVRKSRGYDICWVPRFCRLRPINDVRRRMEDSFYKGFVNEMLECVVERINARAKKHGEVFKAPFEVKHIVEALNNRLCLITFSGRLISDSGWEAVKDVQAMVYLMGGDNYDCEEWRFKPEEEPGEDGEDGSSTDSIDELHEGPEYPFNS